MFLLVASCPINTVASLHSASEPRAHSWVYKVDIFSAQVITFVKIMSQSKKTMQIVALENRHFFVLFWAQWNAMQCAAEALCSSWSGTVGVFRSWENINWKRVERKSKILQSSGKKSLRPSLVGRPIFLRPCFFSPILLPRDLCRKKKTLKKRLHSRLPQWAYFIPKPKYNTQQGMVVEVDHLVDYSANRPPLRLWSTAWSLQPLIEYIIYNHIVSH